MSKIILNGGSKLYGEVNIDNAKNAMLPLISACIMLETRVTFINCPKLDDILVMLEIIKSGKIGEVEEVYISAMHDYHAFSLIRKILNCENKAGNFLFY